MMENLLSSSSTMIETSSVANQSERSFPVTDAEFDGETVLCRVCGDRASGFHYGVHACEGCKGFFRRSIQQKIQYRPCLKNQQCNIQRVNRNRCQYCRLKKCIAVGMSRDAVRFGRVPKKEKARIIEQMQKKNLASQSSELNSLLSADIDIVQAVVTAHCHTCDITQFRAHQMRDLAFMKQEYINCPANMACPLNNEISMETSANRHNLSDFSESFTPAIKSVVDFAKGIPGFVLLNQDDQVTLLKAGTFEVLLVRLACLFDPHSNTMMFTGGKLFKRQPAAIMTTNAGFLLDSMFDFAERFNKMCLIDDEIALFSAVVLLSPDRPGLRNIEQVEKIQNKLTEALQNMVNTNHKEDGTLFAKLLMKTTDLRTLNTLHSEKSIAGQRSNHDRKERDIADDADMDFQDSLSTRSSRSSPTLSETSNMTMTSGYSGESDGNVVIGQRLASDPSGHQIVLRTPYGTFFREEMSGFYGMMTDQPRRRCNTLDRDTLSRPRLHTIEEGNRRRYTLDKEYINKMANRLNDRLESRNVVRGDSLPPSMSNSATSSPIQEEASMLYPVPSNTSFAPITVPEGIVGHPSSMTTRTSPLTGTEAFMAAARSGSSPGSPKSRSRSGSFTQEDYANARPRCFSFHLNSEGRAARMSLPRRMLAGDPGQERDSQITSDGSHYLSPDMRRSSVGASYGLHVHKPSSLVDRPFSYIRGRVEMDKSIEAESLQGMKRMMPDGSIYGIQLAADMTSQHPQGLWHPQATLAMGVAAPVPVPVMQRSRDDLGRPLNSRPQDWDMTNNVSRESRESLQRELGKISTNGQNGSSNIAIRDSSEAHVQKISKLDSSVGEKIAADRSTMPTTVGILTSHLHTGTSSPVGIITTAERKSSFQENQPSDLISDNASINVDTLAPGLRSKASSPDFSTGSRASSLRGSPVGDDLYSESFGHKKFDKFRKDKVQSDALPNAATEEHLVVTHKERIDVRIKEERMEEDEADEESESKELKVDVTDVKAERKGPQFEISPTVSSCSTPSPNSDRPKLSAREAHPNLLAHLMNGASAARHTSPHLPAATGVSASAPSASVPSSFPWAVPSQLTCGSHSQLQTQLFRQPFFTSQSSSFAGLITSSSSLPSSSSSSVQSPSLQSAAPNGNSSNPSIPVTFSSQTTSNTDHRSTNTKEEFHAAAVSHLKDKILRKYDSMENLNKIGKDSSASASGTGSNTSPCTPNPGHWSKSNSPTVQTFLSGTLDLNKELATKLTLSSSTPPTGTMTTSTPPSSSSTAATATSAPGHVFPFSSPPGGTASAASMLSAPAATSHSDPSSRFSPHKMSQLSHMLLSQDVPPASLPMYHSMLSQQYPGFRNNLAAPFNSNTTSVSPLSNMQHLAQMFAQGQVVTGSDIIQRRLGSGSPLNLTSKMEEDHVLPSSSSPSQSPQTMA